MSAAAASAGAAQVQDCSTGVLPAGWPPLQVLTVFTPRQPGAAPEFDREAARRLVRKLVVERFGTEASALLLQGPSATRGARAVSFSHEAGVSLVAWCPNGTVGVDLVDLDSLALASPQELAATAALYLGPQASAEVAAATTAAAARERFALRWAGLEARLKCLGLDLEEWQPARARSLASADVVRVTVGDAHGPASRRWIGCVAWRAGAPQVCVPSVSRSVSSVGQRPTPQRDMHETLQPGSGSPSFDSSRRPAGHGSDADGA